MIEYFSLTGLLIEPERHIILCASGSVVEYRLAKARVAGSNPVSRSQKYRNYGTFFNVCCISCCMNLKNSFFDSRQSVLSYRVSHA